MNTCPFWGSGNREKRLNLKDIKELKPTKHSGELVELKLATLACVIVFFLCSQYR
jgi:hypothetical protein